MKIYKDVFSGDVLFSDNYPMKLVDDCLYEVYGNFISLTEGADGDEGGDVVDLVLNHRLTETGFRSKSDFWVYFKDYLQKLVKYLERNDRASEVNVFRMNINNVMKELLGKFEDLQFFRGASMDADAMILIMEYKDYEGEKRPVLMAFKHGLSEEEC